MTPLATSVTARLVNKPEVGGHLVVAAAPGVEPGAGLAGQLGDPALDGGVDVLVAGLEDEGPLGQLLLDLGERAEQDTGLLGDIEPAAAEATDMGPAAGDVVGGEPAVEREALGEGEELLGRLPAPKRPCHSVTAPCAGRAPSPRAPGTWGAVAPEPERCRLAQVSIPRPQIFTNPRRPGGGSCPLRV